MIDSDKLRDYMLSGAAATGLAKLLETGDDTGAAAFLNSPAADDQPMVPVTVLHRNDLAVLVMTAAAELLKRDEATRAYWTYVFQTAMSLESVSPSHPVTAGLIASAVAAKLLTQAQVDSVVLRRGTWAEVEFGSGVAVTSDDVAKAMKEKRG